MPMTHVEQLIENRKSLHHHHSVIHDYVNENFKSVFIALQFSMGVVCIDQPLRAFRGNSRGRLRRTKSLDC